jgi:hypothetical protein
MKSHNNVIIFWVPTDNRMNPAYKLKKIIDSFPIFG